ncbi:MAG: hypothetical protein MR051_01495 [Lentisphaeria bacterium]|nr:hypothetical protein [Lentisphaeria bacterium]
MEKSNLIVCPLAVCMAVVLGVAAAETPTATGPSARHEQSVEKDFARQDARAAEADKLAAAGKYDEAINILKGEVVEILKLQSESVDSWKAKRRLNEFSDRLRDMQLEYGKKLLSEAEEAYANADYTEAIRSATLAKEKCEELTSRANDLISAAQSRSRAAEIRSAGDPEKIDPQLAKREQDIKVLLASVRTLLQNKKFEEAGAKVEEIFVLNPYNAEAAQLANEIYKNYYIYGYRRRQADNAGILAKEAWQWVEPVFPREVQTSTKVDSIVKSADDHGIQSKLDRIIFPMVRFDQTEITAVIQFLRRNANYDTVDKKGVVIDFDSARKGETEAEKKAAAEMPAEEPAAGPDATPAGGTARAAASAGQQGTAAQQQGNDILVTLSVDNVSLRELLNYICYLTGLTYTVQDDRVKLGFVSGMEVARYDISPGVTRLVDNYEKGVDEAPAATPASSDDEGGAAPSGGGDAQVDSLSPDALKKFFGLYGVKFPEGSSISFFGGKVLMTNTLDNQRRLAEILQELNEDKPMVQVEVKSIELQESDMEELGFNWSLNTIHDFGYDSKGNRTGWLAGPGSNTNYSESAGQAAMLSMLGNALSGVDSRLIQNLNIFPDIIGSMKPFGSEVRLNLSLTINALDRSDRTEMISAPKVLVNSGQTATVTMGKRYYFPESWDDLEIEIEDSDGDNGYAYTLTLPTPTFGESQTMGTVFTVTPTVLEDNRTIRLNISPKITSYIGKDEYTMNVLVYRQGRISPDESYYGLKIWRPVIATRSLDVQVDVYHGETLVLGGLSDSLAESRLDKIPILADIPFIGRLFQSHSETSNRRNMLVFVTAKLMDSSGVPIRRMESNFGKPEIGR